MVGKHLRRLGPFDGGPSRYGGPYLRFAPDGTLICFDQLPVTQWDIRTGHASRTYPVPWRGGRNAHAHASPPPTGALLALGLGEVLIFETLTGVHVHTIPRTASALAFSPDGDKLAVGADDGSLTLWRLNPHPGNAKLLPGDLDKLWLDLSASDAKGAHQALWRLIDAPEQALPFLAERLTQAELRDPRDIPGLIDIAVHADARCPTTLVLVDFRPGVEEPLYEALRGKLPIETRKQIERILAHISEHPRAATDLQRLRSVQLLERIDTPPARKLLDKLANGPLAVPITQEARAALGRLQARQALPTVEVLSDARVAEMRQHLPGTREPIRLAKNATEGALALSPDGRWLACVTDAKTVRVFDAVNGQQRAALTAADRVAALAFAPDSERLICAGGGVQVWHFLSGNKIHELKNHDDAQCVAVSPDGQWVAAGSKSGALLIWPSAGGAVQHRIKVEVDAVTSLVFTPDSQAILVAGMKRETVDFDGALRFQQSAPIRQWSVATGKLMRKLDVQGTHLAFAADQRTLIVSGCTRIFVDSPDVQGLALGGYGGFLVTIDGTTFTEAVTVTCWDWQEGRVMRRSTRKGPVSAVSADGRCLLSGGNDRHIDSTVEWATNTITASVSDHNPRLHLWEALTGQEVLRGPSSNPSAVAIAPTHQTLAWIDGLNNVQLWHLAPVKPAAAAPAIEPLWNDLASADAERAWQAQWILRGYPRETLAWLKTHLQPSPRDQDQHIATLAGTAPRPTTSRRATPPCARCKSSVQGRRSSGSKTCCARRTAARKRCRRIQALLDAYRTEPLPAEELRQARAVQVLQWIGDGEIAALLETLAQGSALSRQTREVRSALKQLQR